MKILFCANIFESKVVGPARFAEMLLKLEQYSKGKHEVRILTADVKIEAAPVYKMSVHYPYFLQIFDFAFRGWSFYKNIRRIKKEFSFDVILFGNAINALFTSFFIEKIPVGGMINDYNSAGARHKGFVRDEGGVAMFLLSFVEQFAVQKLDYTVAVSSYLKNLIIRNYKTPHRKVHLLYQAVDVDKILFKTVPSDMTMPVKILFVKNRFTLGGLPEIPEALSLLKEFNFHLDIAGPENLHLAEIEQMFKDVPHVSIRFWGPVPQDTIHQLMKSSHLLCHPARRDALPLTVIEALAHGLPVVSTTVGGIPEILDNGINGWLCEANNPYTLAEALKNCINASPKEQLNKSLRGRAFVEKTFNYPMMLENLLEILESAIEKKSLHAQ